MCVVPNTEITHCNKQPKRRRLRKKNGEMFLYTKQIQNFPNKNREQTILQSENVNKLLCFLEECFSSLDKQGTI